MSCRWQYLASLDTPEHMCEKPGHMYCLEHQKVMEYLKRLDDDFEEIEGSHEAVR